jgi:hypothetical protein
MSYELRVKKLAQESQARDNGTLVSYLLSLDSELRGVKR